MNRFLLLLILLFGCTVSGCSTSGKQPGPSTASIPAIWFEANNMGTNGGMPTDFVNMFTDPSTWKKSRGFIQVYMLQTSTLFNHADQLNDAFFSNTFIPLMKQSGIQIAIDATGATWMTDRGRGLANKELSLIQKLRSLGAPVKYVALQSVLSKPMVKNGKQVPYPMESRVNDVVEYAKMIKNAFPDMEIGLIDALPSHGDDYTSAYREVASALQANKIKLDFINLDCPYDLPQSGKVITWQGVKQVEDVVKTEIGAHFGLITTSNVGGAKSDEAFNNSVLDVPVQFHKAGGDPDAYVLMSWYPHPQYLIPDTAGEGKFPALKTVVAFHQELQSLYK